jgi:N-acetylglucosamine-6-sulfatase
VSRYGLSRARFACLLAPVIALLALPGPARAQEGPPSAPSAGPSEPNVVLVMTDDQTVGDMAVMPRTRRLIGAAGVTFTRSFVSYPVCCPSRATYLTGQYAHNNHVLCLYPECGGGVLRLDTDEYLPVWLGRAGYVTAHVGKYLNGYGIERPADHPPGWTEWYGLVDHSTYRMWGYKIHENERTRTYGRPLAENPRYYQTDVLTRKGVAFIRRRAPEDAPFFLSMAYVAPHHESSFTQKRTGRLVRPAPRHRGAMNDAPFPRPASYNEQDVADKPWFLGRWNPPLRPSHHEAIQRRMRERRESLLAVDEGVARIVRELGRQGVLGNTYVIFTSDNGFMQGEHRVPLGKMLPYDPSTQVPLLIRGPNLPRNRTSKALVGNIDLAPTILDGTQARARLRLDGRSFLPFARNPRLRSLRPLLHETGGNGARGRGKKEEGAKGSQPRVPAWRAVRTTRWLFVDYEGGQRELYDLRHDPAQLHSLSGDPRFRVRLRTLRRILTDLADCAGDGCRERAAASVR